MRRSVALIIIVISATSGAISMVIAMAARMVMMIIIPVTIKRGERQFARFQVFLSLRF